MSAGDAVAALACLDPGMAREPWVRVAFAFKDAGGTEDEWLAWCEGGGNFNRQDALATFRNAKPRAGGVTAATLFMMAADAGYKPHRGNGGNGAGGGVQVSPRPAAKPAARTPEPEPTDPAPVWEACSAVHVHPYTSRKGVKPHGCRVSSTGALVVPYYNRERQLQTVQTIATDGTKRFLAGARQKGSVAILGDPLGAGSIAVAEGFATGAAIFEASGTPVLCSGSRGTLPEAALMARDFTAMGRVIIAADRGDLSTPLAAARAVAGFLALPGPDDSPDGFDFADWRLTPGTSDAEIAARLEHAPPVPIGDDALREPAPEALNRAREALTTKGPPPTPEVEEGPYLIDGKGRVVPNLANLSAFLASNALGELKRDTFTGVITWKGSPVADHAYLAITQAVQRSRLGRARPFIKTAVATVVDAVHLAAEVHAYNSCVDWLDTLTPWDGTERLARFFADVCEVEATDYVQAVGRYFWQGMVARMVTPGAQVDAAITLVGPQGIGKSSLARIVGGERYGTVGLADIGSKDWYTQLRGKIVVEISELAGHARAELETLKAILTHTHDEYRVPYARSPNVVARGCVFIATTNENDFLQDASGNRRWLPVQCKAPFNLDTARAMREACFAEAYANVRAGLAPTWWQVPDAIEVQERHLAADPWVEFLDGALRGMVDGKLPLRVKNAQIYDALKIPPERQHGGATGRRINAAMRALGYASTFKREDDGKGKPMRGFEREEDEPR